MRIAIAIALALLVAACGQAKPASNAAPDDASAGSSGAGRIAEEDLAIDTDALAGVWSFDRSCASGDGMRLNADGTASFDEWGQGTWARGADDVVVLTLARSELGVGPTGETVIYTLSIAAKVTDDLIGQFTSESEPPRGINAKRCAE